MSRSKRPKSGSPPRSRKRVKERVRNPPKPLVLYCDEAGNAGSNWLDDEQPYHVEAGWLIRPGDQAKFDEVMARDLADSQAEEMKGSRLLRKSYGQRRAATIIQALAPHGIPFFIAADRRFCIAGKAVEVFMDPATNPEASWLHTGSMHERQAVWEAISSVPQDVLSEFGECYRDPSVEGLRSAAGNLAAALAPFDIDQRIGATIRAAAPLAETIVKCERHDDDEELRHAVATALNTPVFFHLVKKADALVGAMGKRLEVVHDHVQTFDKQMERAVYLLGLPEDQPAVFRGADGSLSRMGVQHVTDIRFADSRTVLGLQAADVLAATISRLLRDHRLGRPWTPELLELAMLTLPALLTQRDDEAPATAGILGHRSDTPALLRPVMEEFLRRQRTEESARR